MEKIIVAARSTQVCLAVYRVDEEAGTVLAREVVSWVDGVPMVTNDAGTLTSAADFCLEDYKAVYVGFADSVERLLELSDAVRDAVDREARDEARADRKTTMRSMDVQELLERLDVPIGCREQVVDALVHIYGDGMQGGRHFFTSPNRATLIDGFVRAVMDGLTSRGLL